MYYMPWLDLFTYLEWIENCHTGYTSFTRWNYQTYYVGNIEIERINFDFFEYGDILSFGKFFYLCRQVCNNE